MVKALLAMSLVIVALSPQALADVDNGGLTASVDRNEIHANETLKLEVQGEIELEFDLGTLFNISSIDIPAPDTTPLEEAFEILDMNQHMSVRSVNGEHSAEATWTYHLAPRESGELTIPELHFRNQHSQPLTVTVLPGVSPEGSEGQQAHLDVSLHKDSVYVREQALMTQRIRYVPPLIRGNVPPPQVDNATVDQAGEQLEYTEEIDGREWQVVERRFVITPHDTGTLEIPQQQFQGRKRNNDGEVVFLRATAAPHELDVEPPPASFSGDFWLPASSLDVSEEWSSPPETLRAGDSISRTIRIRALGVTPEGLPRIDAAYPDSLREYPEPWESESRITDRTMESVIEKTAALVPIEPGAAHIPEIRIPWWDVVDDVERVAVIQGRDVLVEPAAAALDDSNGDEEESSLPGMESTRSPGAPLPAFWMWLAAALATGWLVTGIAWWRNRNRNQNAVQLTARERALRERFNALCRSARQGEADTLTLLPQWVSDSFNRPQIKTVGDATAYLNDPQLTREVEALERHLFASPQQRESWDGENLVSALQRIAGQPRNQ